MVLTLPDGSTPPPHSKAPMCPHGAEDDDLVYVGEQCPEDRCSLAHWSGQATCSERDQFVKSVGRKLALTRTLESWTFCQGSRDRREIRAFRRAVWGAYFAATVRAQVRP